MTTITTPPTTSPTTTPSSNTTHNNTNNTTNHSLRSKGYVTRGSKAAAKSNNGYASQTPSVTASTDKHKEQASESERHEDDVAGGYDKHTTENSVREMSDDTVVGMAGYMAGSEEASVPEETSKVIGLFLARHHANNTTRQP